MRESLNFSFDEDQAQDILKSSFRFQFLDVHDQTLPPYILKKAVTLLHSIASLKFHRSLVKNGLLDFAPNVTLNRFIASETLALVYISVLHEYLNLLSFHKNERADSFAKAKLTDPYEPELEYVTKTLPYSDNAQERLESTILNYIHSIRATGRLSVSWSLKVASVVMVKPEILIQVKEDNHVDFLIDRFSEMMKKEIQGEPNETA